MRYKCPECGDASDLEVRVETWAKVIQKGEDLETDKSSAKDMSDDWNGSSEMVCGCGHSSLASEFDTME